jgi:ribosomal protein L10
MVQKITKFEIKSFKLIIKIKKIINIFNKAPFILFFYYDYFNASERLVLRKMLNESSLSTFMIKNEEIKQLSSLIKNKHLVNLLTGNTLLIFNKNFEMIEKNDIKNLLNHPKLILIGGKWNNKFYRIKQIEKYVKLNDFDVKKNLIKEILQISYVLRNILSRI